MATVVTVVCGLTTRECLREARGLKPYLPLSPIVFFVVETHRR